MTDTFEDARESVERLLGWRHLRKYSGQDTEWLDGLRDAIIRVVIRQVGIDDERRQ